MIPVVALTIPVVPLAIISVLSFPMVKIVSYFKNKAIVTLVLSVVMFLGFFVIYMVFVRYIDKFVGSGAAKVLPKALADMIIAIDNVVLLVAPVLIRQIQDSKFRKIVRYFLILKVI